MVGGALFWLGGVGEGVWNIIFGWMGYYFGWLVGGEKALIMFDNALIFQ